jgi:hypothetical protein
VFDDSFGFCKIIWVFVVLMNRFWGFNEIPFCFIKLFVVVGFLLAKRLFVLPGAD